MKISITKDIKNDDWDYVLKNSKDSNITLSPEYFEALNGKHEFLRMIVYENKEPIALIQGKIFRLKNISFLKKLVIGNMSGSGIAIIESKKKEKDSIHRNLIDMAEKEKIDLIEIWALEKTDLAGYETGEAYTIILHFDKDIQKHWARLDRKTRNLIKKAEKSNASIKIDDTPDLKKYYDLYKETSERGNFEAIDYKTLSTSTKVLAQKKMLKVFATYFEEKIVSFAFVLCYRNSMYYWIGASNEKSHKVAGSDLLQWKIIEWGVNNSYKSYNMWGADPNPSSHSYGVYKFKIGFGGELIKIHTYRKYLSKPALVLYKAKETYIRAKNKFKREK